MTKPAITKRSTKGSHLTFTELDTNFQNLSDATFGLQAGTGGTTVNADLNGAITLVAGSGITLSGNDTANTVTIASTSGITNVVEDTTPQLGGDLDVNGYKITSASNANVVIEPNGTGDIYLTADKTWLGDAGAQTVVTTNGDNQLVIGTNNNFTDHTLTFNVGGNIGIKTKATGSFDVTASNKAYFLVDASNQIITNFVTDQSTYRTEVWQTKDYHKISAQNNAGTTTYTSVEVNRTGLKLNNQIWPSADGTANQVLKTDGSGNLSWASVTTAAGSNQQIQFNNSGVLGASSGLIYDGTHLKCSGNVESQYSSGDEGGEFILAKPQTNTSLAGQVTIDIYQNKLRFFENGGSNRGAYIDLSLANSSVGTNLLTAGTVSLFSAYAVTGSTLTGTGTWGLITLDGEEYDTAGHFDSTTFYRFKPTVAGYYQLSGIVGPGTATVNQIGIWKNGTAYKYGDSRNISCVVYLNGSTDYVQLYASGPATGTTGTSMSQTRLEGFFLRS